MPNGAFVKVSSFTADAGAARSTIAPSEGRRKVADEIDHHFVVVRRGTMKKYQVLRPDEIPSSADIAGRWDLRPFVSLIRNDDDLETKKITNGRPAKVPRDEHYLRLSMHILVF
ncbi:unnamed protein product [Leptosia nina]|uniref:Uncharacterized protein n=1 Tax=Leptosia nina TaxID=320188 RepID=A0AAV1JQR9_9NEOP